ncbi:hypothetical protein AWH56_007330 [Anaerobacillus isosaccharinicus]|uniref:Uncharacterized protein n=1 Tax=Anaerobacillus isosaccharinicus TaxID=1532552 RepID=A0A1S2MFB4_9BACI|nr:hypothetical protein [Anaerobacillus isosaccharinicus]MBA5584172.1 hypothetical protein [Anaerobacillus isosaccharinicus]QOY37421.1 hypothetical protein AWH56_007330 [Anaerobacillus isosaccharinicus]
MKKLVRGFVLLVTILLLQLTILPPNEALSNNPNISLTELNIKVMPEFINPEDWDYNNPSLLVGYHGTITNHSEAPYTGEIKIDVPTHLPDFQAGFVAQFLNEEDAEPIEEDYTVNVEDGSITWTPKNPIAPNESYNFVLEYFSAAIEGVVDRSFKFEFIPEADIDNVNIAVYAPYKAENFTIDKEADLNSMTFGIDFHMFEHSDVKQGEQLDLTVSYTKEDIVTTMEALNDFSAPEDEAHAGFNQQDTETPQQQSNAILSAENIIMISLSLILIGALAFIILRKKKENNQSVKVNSIAPKKIVNKEGEIKKLRKMLTDGLIDEKTYKEKRAKLG